MIFSKWKKKATEKGRIYRKRKNPTSKGKYTVKAVDQPLE